MRSENLKLLSKFFGSMKNFLLYLLILISLYSCDKKLDEKIIKGKNVEISWYRISTITSVHEYVDVSQKSKTKQIIYANAGSIDFIDIYNDTIFIKKKFPSYFYTSLDSIFNYKISYTQESSHNKELSQFRLRQLYSQHSYIQ